MRVLEAVFASPTSRTRCSVEAPPVEAGAPGATRAPSLQAVSVRRAAGDDAPYRVKLIVTVMTTGTGTPLRRVGEYSHFITASSAA